jgi:hypothetical protein
LNFFFAASSGSVVLCGGIGHSNSTFRTKLPAHIFVGAHCTGGIVAWLIFCSVASVPSSVFENIVTS